jgi:hypothetical protein
MRLLDFQQRVNAFRGANPAATDADVLAAVNTPRFDRKPGGDVWLTDRKVFSLFDVDAGTQVLDRLEAAAGVDLRTILNNNAIPKQSAFQRFVSFLKTDPGINLSDPVTRSQILAFSQLPIDLQDGNGPTPIISVAQAMTLVGLAWNVTTDAVETLGRPATAADLTDASDAANLAASADAKVLKLDQWYQDARQQLQAAHGLADSGDAATVPTLTSLKAALND